MVWGGFPHHGVDLIHLIYGTMAPVYVNLLNDVILPFSSWKMPIKITFDDPKYTIKPAKEWFASEKIDVMSRSLQAVDLYKIENLWGDI